MQSCLPRAANASNLSALQIESSCAPALRCSHLFFSYLHRSSIFLSRPVCDSSNLRGWEPYKIFTVLPDYVAWYQTSLTLLGLGLGRKGTKSKQITKKGPHKYGSHSHPPLRKSLPSEEDLPITTRICCLRDGWGPCKALPLGGVQSCDCESPHPAVKR